MNSVLDWVGALILLIGVGFTLVAAIGVVRMPDIRTRMHGGSKPQMLGLLLVILGVIIGTQDWKWAAVGLVILVLQFITAPVGTSMIAQAVEHTTRVKTNVKKTSKQGRPTKMAKGAATAKTAQNTKSAKSTQSTKIRKLGKVEKPSDASKIDKIVKPSSICVPGNTSKNAKKSRVRKSSH